MTDAALPTPPAGPNGRPDADDEIDLLGLLDVVTDNRWLIGAVAGAVLFLGGAYAFLATPIYEANTLIQVEESTGNPMSGLLGEASALFEIRSPSTAEMEILRSRLVVGQAVDNLGLTGSAEPKYIPIVGEWLARRAKEPSEPGFLGMAGFVCGNESIRLGKFEVPAGFAGEEFYIALTGQGYALLAPNRVTVGEGKFGEVLDFTLEGQPGSLVVAEARGKPGAEFVLTGRSRLSVVDDLQKNLKIAEKGRQSGVISASLQGADPVLDAKVLNEIGALYVRQNVERRAAEAEKALEFLNTLMPELRKQLEESENLFNQFRNREGTFDLSTEAKLVLEKVVDLQTQLLALEQRRKQLESQFTAQHPMIKTIDAQIQGIQREIDQLNRKTRTLPSVEQDLLQLMRDVKVNTETYSNLINSFQQLRLVKEGKVGNVRIVDAAVVPERPVKPRRALVLALSLMLGLFLGLAAAFVRNSLRDAIREPTEIEQAGLHVFATVPHSEAEVALVKAQKADRTQGHLLAVADPQDPAIESLRSLRSALQFALLDAPNNIVLFTGATQAIGKSFVSANFAAVLGAADKSVLLIDADLRKGHLNRYFGMARGEGLSEVIAGTAELSSVLRFGVAPNVDFLSTGTIPPNPAELLMTVSTQALLRRVAGEYDYVVIDTPPVLAATDSAILAPLVGAVFLVARAGVSRVAELQDAVRGLARTGGQVDGVVFDDLDTSKRRYRYGYGYGYSYRYTAGQQKSLKF